MRFLFYIAFLLITAVMILATSDLPNSGFVDSQRNPHQDSQPSMWKWPGVRAFITSKSQQLGTRTSELQKPDLQPRSRIMRRRRIHP